MRAGTVVHLTKSFTVKSGGCIATYKLVKNATIPVLVLPLGREVTPEQLEKIRAILGLE